MQLPDSSLPWTLTVLLTLGLVVTLANSNSPAHDASAVVRRPMSAEQDDELVKEHGQQNRRITELQYELLDKDKQIAELKEKLRGHGVTVTVPEHDPE